MLGHTSLPNENASLPLQLETEQTALSWGVASVRTARILWTGLGFAVLLLISVSACERRPLVLYAPAKPALLVPAAATIADEDNPFIPSLPVPNFGSGRERPTALHPQRPATRPPVTQRQAISTAVGLRRSGEMLTKHSMTGNAGLGEVSLAPEFDAFGMQVVHEAPPIFRIPNFLTPAECDALIAAASANSEEATEYLNARVNSEVTGASSIPHLATGYSQEAASEAVEWSGGAASGLRRRLPREALSPLDERVLRMLGDVAKGRELKMVLDKIYIRPDERTVIVRDATVVHYKEGEGVAPHIDGNDATLLCYLNDVPGGGGGRTVFPEVKVASIPTRGHCLLYDSRKDLLHFAEPVAKGHEKWVMQLLIDFKFVIQAGGMHVDFTTGEVERIIS